RPSEAELNQRLETAARHYIGQHPTYVLTALWWNGRRLFQVGQLDASRQGYATYGAGRSSQDLAVFAFYPLALLAIAGAFTSAALRVPKVLWLVPIVMLA